MENQLERDQRGFKWINFSEWIAHVFRKYALKQTNHEENNPNDKGVKSMQITTAELLHKTYLIARGRDTVESILWKATVMGTLSKINGRCPSCTDFISPVNTRLSCFTEEEWPIKRYIERKLVL